MRDRTPLSVLWLLMPWALVVSAPAGWAAVSKQTQSPSEQAQTYFAEGVGHQKAERYDQAIRAYKQSLKHDRTQAEALSNLGFCYRKLGSFRRAVQYYRKAIRLDPELAEAYEYLGEAYLGLGKLAYFLAGR